MLWFPGPEGIGCVIRLMRQQGVRIIQSVGDNEPLNLGPVASHNHHVSPQPPHNLDIPGDHSTDINI
jgi:hypothetical protein